MIASVHREWSLWFRCSINGYPIIIMWRWKKTEHNHYFKVMRTIFQPPSMLRYRPYFNVNSTSKCRPLYQRWNMVARRCDQYSTIFQRWYSVVCLLGTYCLELKSFSLFKTENGFAMLTFFHILICVVLFGGNCTSVMADKLVKLQKRAARAILDVDFTVYST